MLYFSVFLCIFLNQSQLTQWYQVASSKTAEWYCPFAIRHGKLQIFTESAKYAKIIFIYLSNVFTFKAVFLELHNVGEQKIK